MPHETEALDLRGLKCPLPALFARRALERSAPGAVIEVTADDPLASVDIPHMCHREGYEVIETAKLERGLRFVLKRPAEA